MAQYDDQTVLVYQAYKPSIARYAIEHGRFGGEFSFDRMSWIKPNFLWMMYRCGWATKPDQEMVLGLRISRAFFDGILGQAVASNLTQSHIADHAAWKAAIAASDVRLQWDPDHDPSGAALERRAIQLGLRGKVLKAFGTDEFLEVIDMTPFVAEQRGRLRETLQTPAERVYWPGEANAARIGLGWTLSSDRPGV
ncbi:DUF4291 domain-containing protein [Halovulum sp. GXIMD14793]